MGEIADMMLEGDLCAGCGVARGKAGEGFPWYCCRACEPEDMERAPPRNTGNARKAQRINAERAAAAGAGKPFKCNHPTCSKRFRFASALAQHARDSHGVAQAVPGQHQRVPGDHRG